ncbi:hypothetical protein Fcan01_19194 [Folsomia candida]|uniref:Uncharacterized protein n=1 Tax=Folsomia candida TaxID=158441 RepID=A0A226DMQ5_FOLCA|nr:hypothetical protein Fcan01_19194 [Folsomia candida]
MVDIDETDSDLTKINSIWFTLNSNFHTEMVAFDGDIPHRNTQCDAKKYEPELSSNFQMCSFLSLSLKHNFTLVKLSQHQYDYFYQLDLDIILYPNLIRDMGNGVISHYEVRWLNIQFIFVTPFPTALTGIRAFVLPFDETVWGILLTFCVIISLIIVIGDTKRRKFVKFLIEFLNVASILLGHVNGDSLTMFKNKKWVAVPILTVWFLGGRYITMDNLYVGSIYSFLSAIKPPKLPDTLKTLVDSDNPIITLDFYSYTWNRSTRISTLKSLIIPSYTELYKDQETFVKLLENLNKKLIFTGRYFDMVDVVLGRIEQSKSPLFQNGSLGFDISKTWAIMGQVETVKGFTSDIKWSGKKKISTAKDGTTPFSTIWVTYGSTSFFFPILKKGFGQLSSFGLIMRWEKMSYLYSPLKTIYLRDNKNYKKYFFKVMSNAKEQITFHESDPVSMKSVNEVFFLWGMCLLIGIVSIIIECKGLHCLTVKCDSYHMEFKIVFRTKKYPE